jgi:1-acyl-sn-glycerol-3-phosphate acyltransferase
LLHYVLRFLIHWCLYGWFRKIAIVGKENLELDGPIIYVSNHPNAAFDPLLLATHQKPKLFYLAAAEWFGKGFKNYIFRDHFNMIPIARPWLKLGSEASNQQMFEATFREMANGKRIVIYPEGTSVTVPQVRKLRTGAARMKVGGDAYLKENNAKWKEVKVVPVGLNYYRPRRFQSKVVMHLGPPIDFSDITEIEKKNQVAKMTEHIEEKMAEQVFQIEKDEFLQLNKDIYLIYGDKLRAKKNISRSDTAQVYLLQRELLDMVHSLHQNQSDKLKQLTAKIDSFKQDVKKHGFDLRFMRGGQSSTFKIIQLLLGLPFFLVGATVNVLPFAATRWTFEKYMRPKFSTTYTAGRLNPSFLSSMAFIIGIGVFVLWYLLLSIAIVAVTGLIWLIPVLILAGYGLGIYAARYARTWSDFFRMTRAINHRRRRPEAYQAIVKQWEELIGELDGLIVEYKGEAVGH